MLNAPIIKQAPKQINKQPQKKEPQGIDKNLEGILINSHIKNEKDHMSINEVCDSLMITSEGTKKDNIENQQTTPSFNMKKALLPLAIGTGAVFLGAAAISTILKKNSDTIVKKYCEELPVIAHNMNIPEEPHLAVYETLRNPSPRNILATSAVFLFSGLTITAKNFVDGAKEIWLKKREADIERDLQENLISVEKDVFSGKLKCINDMLKDSANYFKKIFKEETTEEKADNVFKNYFSFRGEIKKDDSKTNNNKKKNALFFLATAGVALGCIVLGKTTFSNIRKANLKMDEYAKNVVDEGLKSGKIFSDASNGLSGDAGLISFYSYLNEPRGHLYNWVLNPENKFLKSIFTSFTLVSGIGYLFKEGMDAIKSTTVSRENSKTELDLKKRLVDVEINNFKAKKDSAIQPLMNEFKKKVANKEQSEDELRGFAENILCEIKNGPPYVYS